MILVDWQIKDAIDRGDIKIEPFTEVNINPASIDFTLSNSFLVPIKCDNYILDPFHGPSISNGFNLEKREWIIIESGQFILASTVEKFSLNKNVTGIVTGKSSIGRVGIFIENAGYVDNGFCGDITLELFNALPYSIKLYSGMKIGQISFQVSQHCNKGYGERKSSKYHNQSGVTGSMYYKNKVID